MLRPRVAVVRKILLDVGDGFAEGDEEFFHESAAWGDDVFQEGEAGEVEIAGSQMRQFEVHEVANVADAYIDEQEFSKLDF